MIKIISDTSTLYTPQQASQEGFTVVPLSVTVNGQNYREFEEITSADFLKQVRAGAVPVSSQPAIGDMLAEMEKNEGNKIVVLSMADGLSGTYQSACSARELMPHKEDITVINTKTLCGPHRYMVQQAMEMVKKEVSLDELLKALQNCIEQTKSYLIPQDYEFLRRGGRLTPFAAKLNTILKLAPVVTQTADGKRLEKFAISRNFESAIKAIIQNLHKHGVDENYLITVSHADNESTAQQAVKILKNAFSATEILMHELSPAFITQGGPLCVAVQVCPKIQLAF